MRGDTHIVGGLLVKQKLRLPTALLYTMINPSLPNAIAVLLLYDTLTIRSSQIGSVLPDYDQPYRDNCPNELPEKTGDMLYKVLRKVGASHRGPHTHNVDLWIILLGTPTLLLLGTFINTKEDMWFYLFIQGITLLATTLSHVFLDTLTVMGVNTSYFKYKITKKVNPVRIIPHDRKMYETKRIKLGKFNTPFFKLKEMEFEESSWGRTGGGWEDTLYRKMINEASKDQGFKRKLIEVIIVALVTISLH